MVLGRKMQVKVPSCSKTPIGALAFGIVKGAKMARHPHPITMPATSAVSIVI